MDDMKEFLENIDRVHTTEMGVTRIAKNLSLDVEDVVGWCKERIEQPQTIILRKGKNWYVHVDGFVLTINAYSYTIITAHLEKKGERIMAKNDNAHSIRMVNSINKNIGSETAKQFEESYPLSKSADVKKKYDWALDTCNYLEEHFDLNTIINLRKECRCNDGKSIANKILKYMNRVNSIEQFVELFNKNETFASFEYISENKIHFCYPECYCACVKRAERNVPKTWCYCTLGNAEGIFKEVFKSDIKVTLHNSIISGDDRCVIEVEW